MHSVGPLFMFLIAITLLFLFCCCPSIKSGNLPIVDAFPVRDVETLNNGVVIVYGRPVPPVVSLND